jgi:hypothetical protein
LALLTPYNAARGSHARSSSVAASMSSGGSVGRSEVQHVRSRTEFGKYTEEDDEDYEDVFGKPNSTSAQILLIDSAIDILTFG